MEFIAYQQFLRKIEEEEEWTNVQKQLLNLPWDDLGNKRESIIGYDMYKIDEILVLERNHYEDCTVEKCEQHMDEMHNMVGLSIMRKANLIHNLAFLQFMWKPEVVHSWLADKKRNALSDQFKEDLAFSQTLLTKQQAFDLVLKPFETKELQNLDTLKRQLIHAGCYQSQIQ